MIGAFRDAGGSTKGSGAGVVLAAGRGRCGEQPVRWSLPSVQLLVERGEVGTVPISALLPADSARLAGEDAKHTRMLAESTTQLPPILVHRDSMRIIDGMHRLRAAMLRGADRIEVRYFDGSAEVAFVAGVQANTTHGLPLSLADRETAALRISRSHPHWSDRAIGAAAGLSAKTVSAIRRRPAENLPRLDSRLGRDGRVRPLNSAAGRMKASKVIADRPEASLREIARLAGISPGTARDVRERMRRGADPVPTRQRDGERKAQAEERAGVRTDPAPDRSAILGNLRRDPSLRFTDNGRALLSWLQLHASGVDSWQRSVDAIPPHCVYPIRDLARAIADEWLRFADMLRQRSDGP